MKTPKFTLSFECDNDVFADYPADAVADALLATSKKIRQDGLEPNLAGKIRDNNGNTIGSWQYR